LRRTTVADRVIYKYEVPPLNNSTVEMPAGSKILWLDLQDRNICVWASVDLESEAVEREFTIIGTGHQEPAGEYVGSFQEGGFVGHVYVDPESDRE
jgi:hypothetical protein